MTNTKHIPTHVYNIFGNILVILHILAPLLCSIGDGAAQVKCQKTQQNVANNREVSCLIFVICGL